MSTKHRYRSDRLFSMIREVKAVHWYQGTDGDRGGR